MQKEGLQGGRRAAGEAGGEKGEVVRHTHFVYKRNARAGKWRKRAEGSRAEAEGGAEGGATMGYRECREAWLSHFLP